MMRRCLLGCVILVVAATGWALPTVPETALPSDGPRLVVFLSIDQFRADYLTRFQEFYLPAGTADQPGGFSFLLRGGATYRDVHFAHVPTGTGPGHATLLTGSPPAVHGVVANSWLDRERGKVQVGVLDETVRPVGGGRRPLSPRSLLVTTVGDELKAATAGRSKVVGIAFKDRAAIYMAGHAADTVIWLDSDTGHWVSSSFYFPEGELPEWVAALNSEDLPGRYLGMGWDPLLPPHAYAATRPAPGQEATGGAPFSRPLVGSDRPHGEFIYSLTGSGFGNDLVFEAMKRAVVGEGLGQDEWPDLLAVNLSTNDYIGHDFGPNSPEVMDITVRTDRLLADFLAFLADRIPGGLDRVLVVVTSDHGVLPFPEEMAEVYRAPAGRALPRDLNQHVQEQLEAALGEGPWLEPATLARPVWPYIWLNRKVLDERGIGREKAERLAAAAAAGYPGIHTALTRTQILNGQVPPWSWIPWAVNGFHPRRSGDVLLVQDPGWAWTGYADSTTHSAPWPYDTHVPLLLWGPGVQGGRFHRRVTAMDIAPTLSQLLGIGYPSGCLGAPLHEALDVRDSLAMPSPRR